MPLTPAEFIEWARSHFTLNDDGLIQNLGRYEREPLWVAYFGHVGDGDPIDTEDDGVYAERYQLTDEQRAAFPELRSEESVVLHHCHYGFISGWPGSRWDKATHS